MDGFPRQIARRATSRRAFDNTGDCGALQAQDAGTLDWRRAGGGNAYNGLGPVAGRPIGRQLVGHRQRLRNIVRAMGQGAKLFGQAVMTGRAQASAIVTRRKPGNGRVRRYGAAGVAVLRGGRGHGRRIHGHRAETTAERQQRD